MKEKNHPDPNDEGRMLLTEHLRELRGRVIICILVFLIAFFAALSRAQAIINFLLEMGTRYNYTFVYIAPQELLIELFSVSMLIAVLITLPLILYQIYAFVNPGLRSNEKPLFMLAMVFGLIFAAVGVFFAYKVMLPFMLHFLKEVSAGTEIRPFISVQNYISFISTIFLIFAIVFEMPLASILLTQLGLIKVAWMKKFRKIVIVVIFFIAAVITPPDITSQIMVALPMLVLYEISILLCSVFGRFHSRNTADK